MNGQSLVVEMTPYEITDQESQLFDEMDVPIEFNCKIQTCLEKLRAKGTNLFSLLGTMYAKQPIKMRPKYARKLKKGSNNYAFVIDGQVHLFKAGKGLVKTLNSMDVFVTK